MSRIDKSREELLTELEMLRQRVAGFEEAETERERMKRTLHLVAEGSAAGTGKAYFPWLVRHSAETLGVRYVYVGELVGTGKDKIRTLAFWADDDLGENFQYDLAGSPCETVVGQQVRHYPSRVSDLFPHDEVLKLMGVECYLGAPLYDSSGEPSGILVVMDDEAGRTQELYQSTALKILSTRAGVEIERLRTEENLRARERQQAVISEVGQQTLSGQGLSALMDTAVARVAETLAIEYCKVLELLPNGKALLLRAGVGWQAGLVGKAIVRAELESQAGYTLASSEPVVVTDLCTETRFSGPLLLHNHNVVSGLSVIIQGHDRPFGILGAHTTQRRLFTPDDVNFLQAIANILADAIERKQAEEAVHRNAAWLDTLIATTQDAVVSIDRQGRIVRFNKSAEHIFGYTYEEIVGQKVAVLMPEPYTTEHDGYIERYERTHEPHAIGQIRMVSAKRKNGEVFPIELSVTEVEADDEVHYGAFIRDISKNVQLQERLIEREHLATIGTTAAKLAHEIGNPLNGMSANAQLLERRLGKLGEGVDDRLSSYVRNIRQAVARLSQLLQEFRSLSRREKFYFKEASVETLINEVLNAETPYYRERGVRVELACLPGLPSVLLDSTKMKQVFLNLCKNAVEAMPAGGTLTVQARQSGDRVVCEIADTGMGISGNENIFDPFVTTKAEGTGLGLTIVQQIVAAHGGNITYTSQYGQGTTFTVTLPLVPPAAGLERQ